MKKSMKSILLAGLTSIVFMGCLKSAVFAEETIKEILVEEIVEAETTDLPDNEELFAGYVENVLYSDLYEESASYGTVGATKLKTKESKELYEILKVKFQAIAAGELASTELAINMKLEWTAEELGVSKITSSNIKEVAAAKFKEVVNTKDVLTYLMMDCPYELYWYDKTIGSSTSYSCSYSTQKVTINGFTMKCWVAEEFQNGGTYKINTATAKAAESVKVKAAEIVAANANASAYEKMVAYKDAICGLTSYNYDAADDDNTPYGNPWQLIWVFDGDDSTKVVCEGYSKAFQYLCDLSDLTCYTVDGIMSSWSGAGGHMWNIVTLDGENYLVDVTNCDTASIGYPDKLFLAGTPGSVEDGYLFTLSSAKVGYTYKDRCVAALGNEILTLASSNYTVKTPEPEPETTPVTEVFSDISEGAWYVNAVQYVYDKGTMSGNDGLFNPDKNVTRAQVVTTLYRLSGSPAVTDYRACGEMVDVKAGEWYTDAVCWAYNVGVATGNSETKMFNMNNPVTRQQLAAFLYRFVEYKGLDHSETADLSSLVNADKVADYAKIAVKWSVGAGIISGKQSVDQTGATVYDLAPEATATRAQLATMLQRLCEKYDM